MIPMVRCAIEGNYFTTAISLIFHATTAIQITKVKAQRSAVVHSLSPHVVIANRQAIHFGDGITSGSWFADEHFFTSVETALLDNVRFLFIFVHFLFIFCSFFVHFLFMFVHVVGCITCVQEVFYRASQASKMLVLHKEDVQALVHRLFRPSPAQSPSSPHQPPSSSTHTNPTTTLFHFPGQGSASPSVRETDDKFEEDDHDDHGNDDHGNGNGNGDGDGDGDGDGKVRAADASATSLTSPPRIASPATGRFAISVRC